MQQIVQHQYLTVPERLLESASLEMFSGKLSIPEISMGADVYYFKSPITYDLCITNTGGALYVSGKFNASALTVCARCLEDISLPLSAEAQAYYLIPEKEKVLTEDEEVEYEVLEENNKIDLTSLCIASLSLAFPYIPLCSPDCAGLCPKCGVNRNHEICTCDEEDDLDEEDSLLENNPFAVLKDYKFD